jgi:hypothetical protein
MDPRYHTGIPIWEREVTYPHMEMVNHCHCFHMGIEKFTIPVSIGIPVWKRGLMHPRFHVGTISP